jgi:hypothetical protein
VPIGPTLPFAFHATCAPPAPRVCLSDVQLLLVIRADRDHRTIVIVGRLTTSWCPPPHRLQHVEVGHEELFGFLGRVDQGDP